MRVTPAAATASASAFSDVGVEHRVAVDRLRRVVVRRQQRVPATDEIEVARHHPSLDHSAANLGREHVVLTEDIEGCGGDEQLLVAGRYHRQVGVVGSDLDAVELDDEA